MADRHLGARREAVVVAAGLVVLVGIGLVLPEPYSLAAETVRQPAAGRGRGGRSATPADIERLLEAVAADPMDRTALSDLSDAYLAGSTAEDLQRADSSC